MRILLDTNILIRANPKARGPAREALQRIASSDHVLILSRFLLQELERVLAYPRVQDRWNLTRREIEEYLQILASLSTVVQPLAGTPIVLKDVDDDAIIYTAIAGKADVLCTLDQHFHQPSVLSFCKQHRLKIVNDVELLRLIRHGQE